MTKFMPENMVCKHPGCFVPIYPANNFMYLPVKEIEKRLGRKVTEDDLEDFPVHVVHGGVTLESNRLFLHTLYQGKPLVIGPTKTATPAPPIERPTLDQLKDRAVAMGVRYGVGAKTAIKAARRCRKRGTDLERELAKTAQGVQLAARNRAAKAARNAA